MQHLIFSTDNLASNQPLAFVKWLLKFYSSWGSHPLYNMRLDSGVSGWIYPYLSTFKIVLSYSLSHKDIFPKNSFQYCIIFHIWQDLLNGYSTIYLTNFLLLTLELFSVFIIIQASRINVTVTSLSISMIVLKQLISDNWFIQIISLKLPHCIKRTKESYLRKMYCMHEW